MEKNLTLEEVQKIVESMIRSMDFVSITTEALEEVDMPKGSNALVIGHRAVPEDHNDPYTQRVKLIVHPVDGEGHLDASRVLMIDPRNVEIVEDEVQEKLDQILEQDFAAKDEEVEPDNNVLPFKPVDAPVN